MLNVTKLKAMAEGYSSLGHKPDGQTSVLEIPLDKIDRDETQPRKVFVEENLRELAESIKTYGLLQPIVVRKKPSSVDRYVIVAGERRYRASKLLNAASIRAVMLQAEPDLSDLGYLQMIENLQRSDLTAAEIADFIAERLVAGETAASIGRKLGISKSQMSRYAAWSEMPESIRQLVRVKKIQSIRLAYELFLKWKNYPEAVEAAIAEADDLFEWTVAAIAAIGSDDLDATDASNAIDNEEINASDEKSHETLEINAMNDTSDAETHQSCASDSTEPCDSFDESEAGDSEESAWSDTTQSDGVSFDNAEEGVEPEVLATTEPAVYREPCVIVGFDGKEAKLTFKKTDAGTVSLQFLDEEATETTVPIEQVRLLRIDDEKA